MSLLALLDNSAWARLELPNTPAAARERVAGEISAGRVATSTPFLLEAGVSARSRADHDRLRFRLEPFPHLAITEAVERRAFEAQSQLASTGHHRIPPVDLMIAALADVHEAAVLHYDADFDVILERTDLRFDSRWLAPRGSL